MGLFHSCSRLFHRLHGGLFFYMDQAGASLELFYSGGVRVSICRQRLFIFFFTNFAKRLNPWKFAQKVLITNVTNYQSKDKRQVTYKRTKVLSKGKSDKQKKKKKETLILPTDLLILPTHTILPTVSEDWGCCTPHPTPPLDTALGSGHYIRRLLRSQSTVRHITPNKTGSSVDLGGDRAHNRKHYTHSKELSLYCPLISARSHKVAT